MGDRQYLRDYILANGVFVLVGLLGLIAAGDSKSLDFLHRFLAPGDARPLVRFLSDACLYGFYLFFFVTLVGSYLRPNPRARRIVQAYLLAEIFGSLLVVRSLKMVLGRARPDAGVGDGLHGFAWGPDLHAFPSGHAVDVWICAFFAGLLLPHRSLRWLVIGLAVLVSLTRLMMNVHWPSDVVVGALIGGVISLLVRRYWLLPRWEGAVAASASSTMAIPPR